MTFIVSSVHTGSTHGIPGGAGVRRCVADNGGPHECPPQPFWTGVAMAPCLRPFSRRWTHSPYRFMQVPTNADFRSLSDVGTVLHERTLNLKELHQSPRRDLGRKCVMAKSSCTAGFPLFVCLGLFRYPLSPHAETCHEIYWFCFERLLPLVVVIEGGQKQFSQWPAEAQ